MEVIMFHSTGRTGTAFLSQVFGFHPFDKKKVHSVNEGKHLVTQESWNDSYDAILNIKKTKRLDSSLACNYSKSYLDFKIKSIKKEHKNVKKYMITDHKIGRFFGPSLVHNSYDFKMVRIIRNHDKVASSYSRRVLERKKVLDPKSFKTFIERFWRLNGFLPNEPYIINNLSIEEWKEYSFYSKFLWFSKETESQWSLVKENISDNNYIEVQFEDIINKKGLEEIKKFTGFEWSRDLSEIRVNK